MISTGLTVRYWFATLALSAMVAVAPAGAQSQNTIPQDRDADLTRQQLSVFDNFLDGHPELAEQVRKNPSLVNNEQFVENHPDLQSFLQSHPEVKEDLAQNPNAVMHQENRYDRSEDQDRDRDRDRNDIARGELANMDRFMDSHPEIAEQVRKDPSLVDNKQFVSSHPALQEFLANHPELREEYKENPNAFMHREERFDQREDRRDDTIMDRFMDSHPEVAEQLRKDPSLVDDKKFVSSHPALQQFLADHPQVAQEYKDNPNAFMRGEERYDQREDRRNYATMDRFLDSHPEVAEQLRKDPSLVDNKQFVNSHPEFQEFLAAHPEVSQDFKENPNAFMRQEDRFDRQDNRYDSRGYSAPHRENDVTGGELSSFHQFLEGHDTVAGELSKNPSLATNEEYLENHPALKNYLQSNPSVREELSENPQSFVKSAQQVETPGKGLPKTTMTDPKIK